MKRQGKDPPKGRPCERVVSAMRGRPVVAECGTGVQDAPRGFADLARLCFDRADLACFARGTAVDTASGPCPIEEIEEENLVHTLDNGLQPVRRVLSKKVDGTGPLAPVVFRAGVIGNVRDLFVSPNHRVLLSGWQTQLLAGSDEALAPARDLVNGKTIFRQPTGEVEYFHLLFDRHEIILTEGAATESYHPLLPGADERSARTQAELLALFPHLRAAADAFGPAVRATLADGDARLFRL